MSIQLRVAASASELLCQLRGHLAQVQASSARSASGIPRPIPVVVPSSTVSEWLQVQLARDRGVCMGFEFLTPTDFFRRRQSGSEHAEAFTAASAYWNAANLRWQLLPRVDTFALQLGHDSARSLPPRSRFAFAGLLANTFERYGRHRPEWPDRWAADQAVVDSASSATAAEAWQRAAWRMLGAEPAPPHSASVLRKARSVSAGLSRSGERLFFVVTEALDPLTLETLAWFASTGVEVSLHALLPSLGFLGDVSRRQALGALPRVAEEGGPAWTPHPLLVSLGQQSVGTFLLLGSISPDYAEWPVAAEADELTSATLLTRIQHGIRHEVLPPGSAAAPDQADLRPLLPLEDTSIHVHGCHSPRRELEVLRDELLRAFSELPDLRPDQVLIATPAFDVYSPLVDGVLRAGVRPLPVRQTAIPAREANRIAAGLVSLLRLTLGRCAASELIELLNLPAIQARLEADSEAVARLADLIRNSGLTHGCDEQHRGSTDDTGTWRAALDRILSGLWFGPEIDVVDAAGRTVHPVAGVLHGDEALEARFSAWLTSLAAQLTVWRSDAPAQVWAKRLTEAGDTLLYSEAFDDDAVALRRLLHELDTVTADTPLDAATLLDWLEEQLENATSLRTSVSGDILFGRLDQLHALPCRVLAIVGLQDGAFPRANRRVAWDLLAVEPRRWDNDPRTRDRQLFLNCLLAPTDRLILTASTRSVRTGHDGPFSSCVEELLRVAGQTVRPSAPHATTEDQLVVRHRIHPFSPDYFTGELVPSFDTASARIARDLQRGNVGPPKPFFVPASAAKAPAREQDTISLVQLAEFWKDPARAWMRALQVELPRDETDDSTLDACAISLDALQRFGVQQAILEAELGSAERLKSLVGRLAADRALPPGALGSLLFTRHQQEVHVIAAALRGYLPGVETLAVDLPLGNDVHLAGDVRLARSHDFVIAYRPGKFDSPRHQLLPFVQSVAATVALGKPIGALTIGLNVDENRPRPGLTVEEAKNVLERLVQGYVEGHARPLPFAPVTSTKLAAALADGEDAGSALRAAERGWYESGWYSTGEGLEPASALAWRDATPFGQPLAGEWVRWAQEVAAPLQQWWKG